MASPSASARGMEVAKVQDALALHRSAGGVAGPVFETVEDSPQFRDKVTPRSSENR